MSDSDTWIDGCGVLADDELGAGIRIRFRPTPGRPDLDLVAWVEGGVLVVAGPWSCVDCQQTLVNRVELRGVL